MISDPLCLFDFCLECDGAVAVVTTSAERAQDLRHPPVYILSSAHGGTGAGVRRSLLGGMPDDDFASSGHRPVAKRLYEMAGVAPADVDVALLYDHFTPMVIMQLEDYGFCGIGEGGPFVADGNIRWPDGSHPGEHPRRQPVGGVHHRHDARKEAVEQLRGTAVNQVEGAEVALVTGGPASLPVSGTLLARSAA